MSMRAVSEPITYLVTLLPDGRIAHFAPDALARLGEEKRPVVRDENPPVAVGVRVYYSVI